MQGFAPAVSRQVIEVLPSGKKIFKATLSAWAYDQGQWHKVFGPWPAVTGRLGFAPAGQKKEGDGRTPSGIYPIAMAFGKEPALATGLVYRQATVDDLWVDDPASAQYNQWVSGVPQASSYEKMLRSDGLYDLGAIIAYNTDPVVPGLGSAIFIHIWRDDGQKPTAGCVALDKAHLRELLEWLESDRRPVVAMGHLLKKS